MPKKKIKIKSKFPEKFAEFRLKTVIPKIIFESWSLI